MQRKFHPAVYLLEHLSYSAISLSALIYLFTTVSPKHPLIVLLFLVLLFVFLSSALTVLLFVIKYRADRRVWYLKQEQFTNIYNPLVFISLGIVLFLFLSYIKQVNIISIVLVLVTVVGGYILFKLGQGKSRNYHS